MVFFHSILIIGLLGLLVAFILLVVSKKFAVTEDPLIEELAAALPGTNCGACGFAGCRMFAQKLAENPLTEAFCPVGGDDTNIEIAGVLGVQRELGPRKVARLLCAGTKDASAQAAIYQGVHGCHAAHLLYTGHKLCPYGCLGMGTCARVCKFGAITLKDGIVEIDEEKCVGCGVCVEACPKHCLELMPKGTKVYVACHSNDRGGQVRTACAVGCIGCKRCEKTCPVEAITVTNFFAHVDHEKCTRCGKCVEVCPVGAIHTVGDLGRVEVA